MSDGDRADGGAHPGTVSFRRSIVSDVSWLFAAVVMAGFASLFVWQSLTVNSPWIDGSKWVVYLVVMAVSLLMVGFSAWIVYRHLIIRNPVLILDNQRIINRLQGYEITWDEVRGLHLYSSTRYAHLILEVDRDHFVSGSGRWWKSLAWSLKSLSMQPGYSINLLMLADDEADVIAAVERYARRIKPQLRTNRRQSGLD